MHKLKIIGRWIFNVLCLLIVSLLFLVGVWTRNLNLLWLIIAIALWIAAFKRANWLTLGFLATIAVIIIWLFIPDSGNWRPYNFDYELKDLEAKRAVPDSENAAIAYQKIIAKLDVNDAPPFFDGGKHKECNEPSTRIFWRGTDHPETANFVDERIPLIYEFMSGSQMERCAFPAWTNVADIPNDYVSKIRKLAYLVISSANKDMGEGKINNALEKYGSLVLAGRQLQHQTSFIDLLVGVAIEAMAERQLQLAIIEANLNQSELSYIQRMLPSPVDDWNELYPTIMQYEKILMKNMFGLMLYETNDEGTVRFRQSMPPLPNTIESLNCRPGILQQKLIKITAIGNWFFFPHDPHQLSRIIDEEYAKAENQSDTGQTEYIKYLKNPQRSLFQYLTAITAPAQARVHDLYLRTVVNRRGVHILIAFREYKDANGHWPDSLDLIKGKVPAEALIDPYTGGSYIYKVKRDKFLLYSIGPNKFDQGAKHESCNPGNPNEERADDVLIWPQKYEQAKEFFDANSPS